jgi:hypothetical protein
MNPVTVTIVAHPRGATYKIHPDCQPLATDLTWEVVCDTPYPAAELAFELCPMCREALA